jgi:sigma-B regulation protein RsbU (phosphoserine phosphatase)
METSIFTDIEKGLIEKRAQLVEWETCCAEEKLEAVLGPEGKTAIEPHLHVIDTSIEKLHEGSLGVCTVCQGIVDASLLQMDYTACVCLDHYSDAERRQLESELELSQVVQRALLPQQMPSIAGVEVAAFSRPAQIVGGDYFDFLQFNDGAHGFVIADVSGHGVSAGMLMTSLQTAFHTLVPDSNSPVDVLQKLNRLYIHNIHFTTFVTIFFSRLDLRTRTLTYANAGHSEALLYRRSRDEQVWLKRTGPAIGLIEGFRNEPRNIQLESEDILLLYTDGVTEAFDSNGEQFGQARLAEVIRQNGNQSVDGLIQKVLQTLTNFTDGRPLEDDVTLVAYKLK